MATATIWIPTVDDAKKCQDCERAAYGDCSTISQWKRLLSDKSTVALAYENKGIAVARGTPNGWQLMLVGVRPNSRRKGVATELVSLLGEKYMLHSKLRETSIDALKFIVKAGFIVDKLEPNGYSDCDAIHLVRYSNGA